MGAAGFFQNHLNLLPETVAWMNALGNVTMPSHTFLNALNLLILGMKEDGNWNLLDRFWIFCTEVQSHSLVSVVNPSGITAPWVTNISNINSVSWTAGSGYTGNNSTSYLNTNFAFSQAVNTTLNNGSLGFYNLSTNTGGTADMGWHPAPSSWLTLNLAGNVEGAWGSNGAATLTLPAKITGLWTMFRNSGSNIGISYNGVTKATASSASVSNPTGNAFICALSQNSTPVDFSLRTYALAYVGSGGINGVPFYNRIQTFLTTIGCAK